MCGIAGIISSENPEKRLAAMLRKIEHRGRDDEGVFVSAVFNAQQTALGHRRLSILDPTPAGHQPFFSANGQFVLTYNGEIYNFQELRRELEAKNYQFKTDCDTEVLANLFEEFGAESLEKLNGIFAFAVWDKQEKTLFLARDRAGIKPLYYAQTGEKFVFASEIKAIPASGLIKTELDLEGLHQFLTFLWTVPPHTLFKNIYQLKPAHFLIWKNGEITEKEWWDLDFSREEKQTEDVWREKVLETLDEVTQLEMISDVPLGAFLSGGVDSSSIVALMTQHAKHKVSTFTTGISAEDLQFDIIPDDVEWSRRVAEILKVDYHEMLLTPDVAALLPKLVYQMDAPVIDMAIPSFLISEQARQNGLKVMLSGMGGDEIFAGYPRQMAMKIAGITDFLPTSARRPLMKTLDSFLYGGIKGKFTAPLRNAKKFARSAGMDFEERYLGFGTYFTDDMKRKIYSENLRGEMKDFDAYRYHKNYFQKSRDFSPLNRLLYVDFKTFMPALNLDTTDKTSMAANLEVRVPFLNHKLVSLTETLPSNLKIKGLTRKYILKRAAESLLPKEIIYRKKAGFSAPVRSWIRGDLKPLIEDLLSEETVKKRGLFDAKEIKKLIDLNDSGKEDFNLQIFALLNFEIWMREFLDG